MIEFIAAVMDLLTAKQWLFALMLLGGCSIWMHVRLWRKVQQAERAADALFEDIEKIVKGVAVLQDDNVQIAKLIEKRD